MFEYKTIHLDGTNFITEVNKEAERSWEVVTVFKESSSYTTVVLKRELEKVKQPPTQVPNSGIPITEILREMDHRIAHDLLSLKSDNRTLEHKLEVAKSYLKRISLEDRVEQGHTVSTDEACLAADCLKVLEKM